MDAASGSPTANWHRASADAYQLQGHSAAALAHLAAAAAGADDPVLWHQVMEGFWSRGEWDAARQALETILQLSPQDTAAHFRLGVLLAPLDMRQAYTHLVSAATDPVWGTAAQRLQVAIAEEQQAGAAAQNAQVGMVLASLAFWPQAEQALETAVALNPVYAEAWAYLGLVRARQGWDGASAFERAFAYVPDDPLLYYLYGLMWRAVGDDDRSLNALLEAQHLSPQNPAFAAELGMAYRLQGELVLAEYWLQEAVALAPGEPQFLRQLALFYAEELFNLEGDGLTVLREAVSTLPDDAALQAAYAWALFNVREVTAAEEAISTALSLEPDNPRALYYRGLMYQYQARSEQAIQTLLRILTLPDPQGFDDLARRALENMDYHP